VLLYGLLGLCIGSFLNVVIDRLPAGRSLVSPPSHCETCGRRLTPPELIPLLSFLIQKGRCRGCGAPIPRRLPVVEALTGCLFAGLWLYYGPGLPLAIVTIYICIFMVIFFIDLEHRLILNQITFPAMLLALVTAPFLAAWPNLSLEKLLRGLIATISGGAVAFIIFYSIALIADRLLGRPARPGDPPPPVPMGAGDVKLATLLGLMLGFPVVLVGILLGIVLGGLIASLLLVTGIRSRRDAIPYGPYLIMGGFIALLWGRQILFWYISRYTLP